MLECVVNISEGRDEAVLTSLAEACGTALLDVHSDADHHRSVFTLAGSNVVEATKRLAARAVNALNLTQHIGVHPRVGVLDVVPFVPLGQSTMTDAVAARSEFARWLADEVGVPVFLYGDGVRTLPDVRRGAFSELAPDFGPTRPHQTAGATAVGARGLLVAYNLWLKSGTVNDARAIAKTIRRPGLRTLGLDVGGVAQVSCNLIDPHAVGPSDAYDAVSALADVGRAELVGLVPQAVLERQPRERWPELDLSEDKTIEARLDERGLR